MPDYEKMYHLLFNAITDALTQLEAQNYPVNPNSWAPGVSPTIHQSFVRPPVLENALYLLLMKSCGSRWIRRSSSSVARRFCR